MAKSRYRLRTQIPHRGPFNAGFHAHLSATRFWKQHHDPFALRKRRRKRLLGALLLAVLFLLVYLVIESANAVRLFQQG